jgi:hypothetical protein
MYINMYHTMYNNMCLKQAPKSVSHTYATIYRVYTSTMYQPHQMMARECNTIAMRYTKPDTKMANIFL